MVLLCMPFTPFFVGLPNDLARGTHHKIWRKIWIINSLSNLGSSTTWGWCILDYHTLHCRKNWLRDLTANRSITELWKHTRFKLTRGTWVDFHHDPMHLSMSKIKDIMKVAQAFPLQLLHIHQTPGDGFVVFPLIEGGVRHDQAQIDLLTPIGSGARPGL